jgi:hypothetical protein
LKCRNIARGYQLVITILTTFTLRTLLVLWLIIIYRLTLFMIMRHLPYFWKKIATDLLSLKHLRSWLYYKTLSSIIWDSIMSSNHLMTKVKFKHMLLMIFKSNFKCLKLRWNQWEVLVRDLTLLWDYFVIHVTIHHPFVCSYKMSQIEILSTGGLNQRSYANSGLWMKYGYILTNVDNILHVISC